MRDQGKALPTAGRARGQQRGNRASEAAQGNERPQAWHPLTVSLRQLSPGRLLEEVSIARFGHLDLRAQAEVLSAPRSDTPKQSGAPRGSPL
jgi:hypothetical protein